MKSSGKAGAIRRRATLYNNRIEQNYYRESSDHKSEDSLIYAKKIKKCLTWDLKKIADL